MLGFQPVSRNLQRSQISLLSRRRLHNLLGMAAASGAGVLLLIAEPARAQYSIENGGNKITIWGTGRTSDNSGVQALDTPSPSSTLENTWKLIAFPNDYITTGNKLPTSGPNNNFYIPGTIPSNWAGQTSGNNTPVTLSGVQYRWITYANWEASTGSTFGTNPTAGYAQSYFTPALRGSAVPSPLPVTYGQTPPDYYSYIAQTTFTPTVTGIYDFSTNIAADNFIEVYLGGSVSGADSLKPDITGGTKLLSLATQNGPGLFSNTILSNARTTTNISLTAGQQYYLNYVIRDNAVNQSGVDTFGSSGFIVGTTAFTRNDPAAAVPGPVPALGVAAFLQQAGRLRRRIAKRG